MLALAAWIPLLSSASQTLSFKDEISANRSILYFLSRSQRKRERKRERHEKNRWFLFTAAMPCCFIKTLQFPPWNAGSGECTSCSSCCCPWSTCRRSRFLIEAYKCGVWLVVGVCPRFHRQTKHTHKEKQILKQMYTNIDILLGMFLHIKYIYMYPWG